MKREYYVEFTAEDLAANRAGELTAAQREWLKNYAKMYKRNFGWGLVLFAVVVIGGVGIEFMQAGGTLEGFALAQTPMVAMIVFLFIGVMVAATIYTSLSTRHVRRMTVHRVEGIIRTRPLDRSYAGRKFIWSELKIEGITFQFSDTESIQKFEDGAAYRIYYIPAANLPILLSAERI